ncbi:MAG TPA: ABC transporter permease [Vicinamibacterales bacterium]|nr:ABC transporter permease [Vicinamibacterales bacterium]
MLLQDVRFGLRTALKNKGVTGLAVVCLGMGIGLNTMIFSVTDGVLIQPLPYKDPERIVLIHTTQKQSGIQRGAVSSLDLRDWREQARSFSSVAGLATRNLTISEGTGDTDRYSGAAINAELFPLLGKSAQLGRAFDAADDRAGAPAVVVISDDLWRRRYNADPATIGRTIVVNSVPHTVIGVMPARFRFPENAYLWIPLAELPVSRNRAVRWLEVFGRLREGITLEQARHEADALASNFGAAYPETNRNVGAYIETLRDWAIPADVPLIILTMMGSVTMVLLIACFNVANLMLARASARSREMAIRAALGAARGQILRQLLTESVIVGIVSVPLGLLCAKGGLMLMDLSIPTDRIPYFIHWSIDTRTLLYSIGIAVVTGVVFGLAPALQASRADVQEAMKEGGRGTTGSRAWLRNGLVVAEVALSLVLLVGASLFVRSFLNLKQAALGFDTTPLMTLRFFMPNEKYTTADAKTLRVADVMRRIEGIPGVQAAFASNMIPLAGGGGFRNIVIDGRNYEKGKEPGIEFIGVTAHMLKTLGLSMVRGRDFTDTEGTTRTQIAIVNQAMAKKFWPGEDAVGRRFRTTNDGDGGWFTVIGVAPDYSRDVRDGSREVDPCAYVAYPLDATANTGLTMRVAGDPLLVAGPAREAIRASDSSTAVFQVSTMNEVKARSYWEYFLFGWMFSLFGGVALVLAAVGVYGVLSYSVEQRTQEIGVRIALGAGRSAVLKLIVVQGLRLAAAGVAIGVVGSYFVTPVIRTQLFNVSPSDPLSFIGVSIFLTAIAFLASYVPARRAMAVDPLVALRAE